MEIIKVTINKKDIYTIPKTILKKFNMKPGDKIDYHLNENNTLIGDIHHSGKSKSS